MNQILKYPGGKARIASWIISHELYNEELRGWATSEHTAIAQQGKIRIEKIYMNFDPPLLAIGL